MRGSVIISFLLLAGCTKSLEIDVPFEKPAVVVNSIINADEDIIVDITESKSILEPRPRDVQDPFVSVSDAVVGLYEDGKFLTFLDYMDTSFYTRPGTRPRQGRSYHLEIYRPGYDSVYAETSLPDVPPVLEVVDFQYISNVTQQYPNFPYYEFTVNLTDIPGETYYEFLLQGYQYNYDHSVDPPVFLDSMLTDISLTTNEVLFMDEYTVGDSTWSSKTFLFDDKHFVNETFTFRFSIRNLPYDRVRYDYGAEKTVNFTLTIRVLHKDYYQYRQATKLQDNNQGVPLAEPIFVPSNIQNGLGIFSGYSRFVTDYKVLVRP